MNLMKKKTNNFLGTVGQYMRMEFIIYMKHCLKMFTICVLV